MKLGNRAVDRVLILWTLIVAWCAKSYYSQARFEDLLWLLTPTTRAVEWLTGARFELEAHHGYLSRDVLFEIVPSCAGMNFMIAAFCSLSIGLLRTMRTLAGKLTFVLVCAVIAYLVTLMANTVRIVIAIQLHQAGTAFGALTPERLHRIEGIVVYFLFLCVTFWGAALITGARREAACR